MDNTFQFLIMQIVKHGIPNVQLILIIQIVLQKLVLISQEQLIFLIVNLGYQHVLQCMIILNVLIKPAIIITKILMLVLVILDVMHTNLIVFMNLVIVVE